MTACRVHALNAPVTLNIRMILNHIFVCTPRNVKANAHETVQSDDKNPSVKSISSGVNISDDLIVY
jgi:FtsZ-interacting cell division protein YlmF